MTAYEDRVARARRIVAAMRTAEAPAALRDQVAAADRDAKAAWVRAAQQLTAQQPEHAWTHVDPPAGDESPARLVAVIEQCRRCVHLRHAPVQVATASLRHRRVSCARCVKTRRRPAVADDQCDLCEADGVTTFIPLMCQLGYLIVTGDACPPCAEALGMREAAA